MTSQKCKGARDSLPEDMERFRHIEKVFRDICLGWSYQEVRTPTLEHLHLFATAGTLTPNMLNKVYSFLDWDGWSGERVVLRPDGTIPVARLYSENLSMQDAARLFYVTNVFAFEETGKENRERWQCGIEFIGNGKPTADVEVIMLAREILRKLSIGEVKLQLSHAGMLKALLKELKLSADEEAMILTQILDGNWQVLTEAKSVNSSTGKLLSLLLDIRGKSNSYLENLKALPRLSPELKAELDNFAEVASLLDVLGCKYRIDITSTQGFEYYTGLCFQLSVKGVRVVSGGRYDNLIPLIGGKDTPACGFALYIDHLMNLLQFEAGRKNQLGILVRGEAATTDVVKSCFQLAQSLRNAGYMVEVDFTNLQSSCGWIVTVSTEASSAFIITNQAQGQERSAASIDEVIDIIGGTK